MTSATGKASPTAISSLTPGQRGRHPKEWLSAWILIGPTGWSTPLSHAPARRLRENSDEIRQAMKRLRLE
jgi:hypothetical protein